MTVEAFAPGKLILMGEHAVVYGHPALAMAVDRGMHVRLRSRPGATGVDHSFADDPRLNEALRSVLPATGVGVEIESTLPIGRGMGSSAALAVALGRASLRLEGNTVTPEAVNERAFAVERIFHGQPSGIDHTVSMRGGALLYKRTDNGPEFERFELPDLPIVVIDSGSAGNTAHMVASVAERIQEARPYLDQISELLLNTKTALRTGDLDAIGQAWHENHWLLRAVGVSTPTLDRMVRVATESGATGAKLAGAGGGGVVIALAPNPEPLLVAAKQNGWDAFKVRQTSNS